MADLGMTDTSFDWNGRSVLVTGAGGFVGSWLTKALIERGATVACLLLSDESEGKLARHGVLDSVTVVRGDLVDLDCVTRAVADHAHDACFHLAAQAIVGVANASPLRTLETNIQGTWNVLEGCRTANVERIVVASSDKAYGDQDVLPYTEDMPLAAVFPYDASKACADILARSYARTFGLPLAVTRMANIYGGADTNDSRIVPGTVLALLAGESPLIRSDGSPVRDYMYVDDAVAAFLALAERLPEPEIAGQAFNFGTNAPVSVLELVELIIESSGRTDIEPTVLSPTKLHGEIDRQYLDSSKARELLGWEARTPLREGIKRTIAWYAADEG